MTAKNLRIRTARIRSYVLASEVAGSAFVREVLAAIGWIASLNHGQ